MTRKIFFQFIAVCCLGSVECDARNFITRQGTTVPGDVILYHGCVNKELLYCTSTTEDKFSYCRWKCVMGINQFDMFDKISYNKLSANARVFLEPKVKEIESQGATEDIAQRYSIMCAFDISWNDSIDFMNAIAKEGPFSHNYSLEEALFITHMHTKMPNSIERWIKGKRYQEEKLTYAGCLAGAVAKVLTTDGKLPSDFTFNKATITTESREVFVTKNIKKLTKAYFEQKRLLVR